MLNYDNMVIFKQALKTNFLLNIEIRPMVKIKSSI